MSKTPEDLRITNTAAIAADDSSKKDDKKSNLDKITRFAINMHKSIHVLMKKLKNYREAINIDEAFVLDLGKDLFTRFSESMKINNEFQLPSLPDHGRSQVPHLENSYLIYRSRRILTNQNARILLTIKNSKNDFEIMFFALQISLDTKSGHYKQHFYRLEGDNKNPKWFEMPGDNQKTITGGELKHRKGNEKLLTQFLDEILVFVRNVATKSAVAASAENDALAALKYRESLEDYLSILGTRIPFCLTTKDRFMPDMEIVFRHDDNRKHHNIVLVTCGFWQKGIANLERENKKAAEVFRSQLALENNPIDGMELYLEIDSREISSFATMEGFWLLNCLRGIIERAIVNFERFSHYLRNGQYMTMDVKPEYCEHLPRPLLSDIRTARVILGIQSDFAPKFIKASPYRKEWLAALKEVPTSTEQNGSAAKKHILLEVSLDIVLDYLFTPKIIQFVTARILTKGQWTFPKDALERDEIAKKFMEDETHHISSINLCECPGRCQHKPTGIPVPLIYSSMPPIPSMANMGLTPVSKASDPANPKISEPSKKNVP